MTDETTDLVPSRTASRSRSTGTEDPGRSKESNGETGDEPEAATAGEDGPPSPLRTAADRIRREPTLALPFAIAGLVLTLVDWLRRYDPLPTAAAGGDGISIEFAGYPTGTHETIRPLEALVDLKLPYLAWGIGLEAVALLTVVVAGVVTIARVADGDTEAAQTDVSFGRQLLAYVGLVVLLHSAGRLLGTVGTVGVIFGIPLFIGILFVLARFFAAPAYAAAGVGPLSALRRSVRATRNSSLSLIGLVLTFGLAAWLLSAIPYAGTLLSSTLVAPIHAVTSAVVRARAAGE
ncbi:hypothetical protein [Natrinema sp. 74]|uniref:hypothetical protein n=1 Tax=Natrinema sp. 74 TaxID=3384159 RepID=UPI0038D43151